MSDRVTSRQRLNLPVINLSTFEIDMYVSPAQENILLVLNYPQT